LDDAFEEHAESKAKRFAELLGGVPAPTDGADISAYVEVLLMALLKEQNPLDHERLLAELVRLTSASSQPLRLRAYGRPISAQQLYLDLLKGIFLAEDESRMLVRGLHVASGRPEAGTLWDYLAWTEQTDAGRALRLDWDGPAPRQ
jgi:hypothetical protein